MKPMLATRDGWLTAIAHFFHRRVEAARVGTDTCNYVHIFWSQS